jgi:pimeloyl-ACP methyl ester carboxylesterase
VRSMLLVHGSGSGPWAFDGWSESFPASTVVAVDLQEGLDVAHASIDDYAAAVARAAAVLPRPLALVGWSLGGLVAMVAASTVSPEALVLLDASPPREVQGLREVDPRPGTFDPVEAGAQPPPGMRYRRESSLAMGERDRGVTVPGLPACTRTLVVYGRLLKHDRGPVLAAHLGADELDAGPATHWDLVRDEAVRRRVAAWLRTVASATGERPPPG